MAKITVKKADKQDLDSLGATGWPIWTCGVSTFDYHYDQQETCYVLEGDVTVTAGDQKVAFGPGDLVVFPQGLDCVWTVRKPVKKHYKFG
jgi:uncharacterized cupin superfamily protein